MLYTEHFFSLLNSLGLCVFVWGPSWQLYGSNQMVDMVRAVTGWNVSLWELVKVGERSLNLMRAFNAREGFTSTEDRLPRKLFQPLKGGPSDGVAVGQEEMAQALSTYYAMSGWDPEGRPLPAKLAELGINWVAEGAEL
jgi:aldehyde:ferredoxin oxidoreductase